MGPEELHLALRDLEAEHEFQWILEEANKRRQTSEDFSDARFFEDLLRRKKSGEPLAYILGHWSFGDLELFVGPGVLIPRPETEELALRAAQLMKRQWPEKVELSLVDAGAGSGCLGLLAAHLLLEDCVSRKVKVFFVEQSKEAFSYLQKNKAILSEKYGERFEADCFLGSWTDFVPQQLLHALLSNPPYITGDGKDEADEAVRRFEPREALYPEDLSQHPDGSGPYRDLIERAHQWLLPRGLGAFEMGEAQHAFAEGFCMNDSRFHSRVEKDFCEKDRFLIAEKLG